jgi:hypothetical protein
VVNFIRPLPKTSLVTLGLTGNFDRQRQNERSFTITDTFGGLISKVHANYCTHSIVEANYIYPIAGSVGMQRVIHDFMLLTLFANLGGTSSGGKEVTKVTGPPTMVDQLQFQTTIGGVATPKIVFIPLGQACNVARFGFAQGHASTNRRSLPRYDRRKGDWRRTIRYI